MSWRLIGFFLGRLELCPTYFLGLVCSGLSRRTSPTRACFNLKYLPLHLLLEKTGIGYLVYLAVLNATRSFSLIDYLSSLVRSTPRISSMFGRINGLKAFNGSSMTREALPPSADCSSRRSFSFWCSRLTILYFRNKKSFCLKVHSGPIQKLFYNHLVLLPLFVKDDFVFR